MNAEEGKAEEASFSAQVCPGLLGNSHCLVVFIGLILVSSGAGVAWLASAPAGPHHPHGAPSLS